AVAAGRSARRAVDDGGAGPGQLVPPLLLAEAHEPSGLQPGDGAQARVHVVHQLREPHAPPLQRRLPGAAREAEPATELSQLTRTSRGVIGDLCGDRWQRVGRDTIARICEELGITSLDDLFQLYDTNIFFPIR